MQRWIALSFLLALFSTTGSGFAKTEDSATHADPNPSAPELSPTEIVRRADRNRVPESSYELDITVLDFVGTESQGENTYRSYVKDLDHALVEFRTPASERGKSLLMLEDDVWIYLPRVRKPIRVPLRQRLLGQVAIGDMIRTNFAEDYTATLAKEETMDGKAAYVLDLEAKSPKKTYQKIRYWVAKESFQPLFAEYFSARGISLKSLTFKDFRMVAGKKRPMLGVFQDSIQKDRITHLRFDKMEQKSFQDMMFTPQYMRTFE